MHMLLPVDLRKPIYYDPLHHHSTLLAPPGNNAPIETQKRRRYATIINASSCPMLSHGKITPKRLEQFVLHGRHSTIGRKPGHAVIQTGKGNIFCRLANWGRAPIRQPRLNPFLSAFRIFLLSPLSRSYDRMPNRVAGCPRDSKLGRVGSSEGLQKVAAEPPDHEGDLQRLPWAST